MGRTGARAESNKRIPPLIALLFPVRDFLPASPPHSAQARPAPDPPTFPSSRPHQISNECGLRTPPLKRIQSPRAHATVS